MKKIVVEIEGMEYALHYQKEIGDKHHTIIVEPLPLKQKTIVQVVAETWGMTEEKFKQNYPEHIPIYDAIEQRLQAIEQKLEGK
jgi:hypothetical protein